MLDYDWIIWMRKFRLEWIIAHYNMVFPLIWKCLSLMVSLIVSRLKYLFFIVQRGFPPCLGAQCRRETCIHTAPCVRRIFQSLLLLTHLSIVLVNKNCSGTSLSSPMRSMRLISTISTPKQTGSNSITECKWINHPIQCQTCFLSCWAFYFIYLQTGAMGITMTTTRATMGILEVQGCSAPRSR